ncbi:MAG: hypothetical protein Q4C47_05495, partial [Planctomycetia bacterium]|nr:hypothetical protein [Planctomycetia bacterium]
MSPEAAPGEPPLRPGIPSSEVAGAGSSKPSSPDAPRSSARPDSPPYVGSVALVLLLSLCLCFLYTRFSTSFLGLYSVREPLTNEIQPPAELAELFRPGDWELEKTTRIVRIRNVMILVSQIVNPEAERMVFSPCTIVCFPEGETDPVRRVRDAVMVRVRGTVEVTLKRDTGFGDLAELRIPGQLEIFRSGDPTRPEESFFLMAENVNVNAERLWTPGDFSVRCGRHSGEGTGLRLKFLRRSDREGDGDRISFSDIDTAEIQKLKYFTFAPGAFRSTAKENGAFPQSGERPENPENSRSDPRSLRFLEGDEPVSVTCHGQMNFRFQERQLSLLNYVQIIQGSPESPTGRMQCENLTLELAPSEKPDRITDPVSSDVPVWTGNTASQGGMASPQNPGGLADLAGSGNVDPESLEALGEAGAHSGDVPENSAATPSTLREFSRMKIRRFEAIGYPAKLYSAADDLYVEAKAIQYDAATESLKLTNRGVLGPWTREEPDELLVLRQGANQFETHQLQCTLRPDEGLVRCSSGSGRLTFWPREDAQPRSIPEGRQNPENAELCVTWNGRMEFEPDPTAQPTHPTVSGEPRRLLLTGGVVVTGTDRDAKLTGAISVTGGAVRTGETSVPTEAENESSGKFQISADSVSMWLERSGTSDFPDMSAPDASKLSDTS